LSKQRGSESDDKEEDEVKKLMMMISESHDRFLKPLKLWIGSNHCKLSGLEYYHTSDFYILQNIFFQVFF
jgi:hypothetical protein